VYHNFVVSGIPDKKHMQYPSAIHLVREVACPTSPYAESADIDKARGPSVDKVVLQFYVEQLANSIPAENAIIHFGIAMEDKDVDKGYYSSLTEP